MQNRLHLTDLAIRNLAFSERTSYVWDVAMRGFGLRIGKQSKTFVAVRDGGRRTSLGKYPAVPLRMARERAKAALYGPRAAPAPADAPTAAQALAVFLQTRQAKNKPATFAEANRVFNKHFLPAHADKPITTITTRDLTSITDSLMEAPAAATHVHSAFKTFFNWCVERRYIHHSPLAGIPPPAKPAERERVLTDKELVAVYEAARSLGYPYGYIVLTCIHTMLRRNEVASLKWTYITDTCITLPKELMKNGREHVLPNLIGPSLADIPRTSQYLFPSGVGTPFSDWSKQKRKIDKLSGVSNWTLHDLRRTGRSKLAEWECCSPEIAERILGHVTAQSKIARIYNRWSHLPQMKVAMERYEQKLAELLGAR